MMRRNRWIILVLIAGILFSAACSSKPSHPSGKLLVEASFEAIAEFARAVGGDKVEVHVIIPAGIEPHDFEPKARDLARLSDADVFVYNGIGMEGWADKAIEVVDSKKLITVDTSKGADLIRNTDADALTEHGAYDPHLWLSLDGAKLQSATIREALCKADPKNSSAYKANWRKFKEALDGLEAEYQAKLQSQRGKSFVTGHAAFAYLCREFGLTQESVENVFAEGEPSAARLKELVDFCRSKDIRTVFMEELASPRITETLAREVGAKVVEIHTVESSEEGMTYLKAMKENLERIEESLVVK